MEALSHLKLLQSRERGRMRSPTECSLSAAPDCRICSVWTCSKKFFSIEFSIRNLLPCCRYSILGEHAGRFAVDAETGAVSLATPLDREEHATYQLTLVAKDSSATDPRSSAVNLTVAVLDENDNDPTFSEAQYTVHVPSGTGKGEGSKGSTDQVNSRKAAWQFRAQGTYCVGLSHRVTALNQL